MTNPTQSSSTPRTAAAGSAEGSDAAVAAEQSIGEGRDKFTWRRLADFAAAIGLVIVFIGLFIATPNFLTVANITDVLVASSVLAVMALGQQMVVVVGGIDLSMGATLPWCAAALAVSYGAGAPLPLAMLVSVLAGLLIGLVNGVLISLLNMTDFVVTLGMLSIVGGITFLLTGGNNIQAFSPFLQGLALNGLGPIRWFWLVAVVLSAAVWVYLFRTRAGTHLLATGGDIDAARSAGVAVRKWRLLAYIASGVLTGIAAILFVARNGGADPTLQTNLLLSSIAAVVLGGSSLFGGKASVIGTLCGAVLLTSLINGFTLLNISQAYQPIAVGAVVLMAALIARFNR